jgi:hypothetical protein
MVQEPLLPRDPHRGHLENPPGKWSQYWPWMMAQQLAL